MTWLDARAVSLSLSSLFYFLPPRVAVHGDRGHVYPFTIVRTRYDSNSSVLAQAQSCLVLLIEKLKN